jgi:RNA polymerase sigma factor (sigma-70 family)
MTPAPQNPLVRFLHRLAGGEAPLVPDAELLRRFVQQADRSAFELLLWRHGPMVLRTCRAVLHDPHDADDAFQAAFLVLARKAGSIGRREALGGWLYRVAHRIAVKLHRQGKRRETHEQQGLDLAAVASDGTRPDPVADGEVRRLLHAEVEQLPEKYRAPVVLCYLEGRTNDEAAAQLGWTKGTVSGRLARARDLLRRRLERKGLTASGGLILTHLAGEATAAVPDALVVPTLQAAAASAAGGSLTGLVPPRVLSLIEGAASAMTAFKLHGVLGLLLGLTAAGAVAFATTGVPGGGDGEKKVDRPGAPAAKSNRVRVPSRHDGILLAVGTEVKKGAPGKTFKVQVDNVEHVFRRLREGDKVQQGQMLARLEDRLARHEVAIARAKLAAARADFNAATAMANEAQARLTRLDGIKRAAANAVAAEEYSAAVLTRDKHRQEAASKAAGINVAQLDVDRAETILADHTIRSPVSGVIRRILKHHGEAVRRLETVFEIEVAAED